MATQSDLLSLLNLCDPAELAAILAQQSQPLISEPLGDGALLEPAMASLLGEASFANAGAQGWPGLQDAAAKNYLLQEMAQSLAMTMEQQRKQQQLATALQLRALQQQQELAALQQLNTLNAATSGPSQRHLAAFSRAISSDLEYRSAQPLQPPQHTSQHNSSASVYQRASSVDLENLTTFGGSGLPQQHVANNLAHSNPHLLPARSYSSEHLEPRRHPLQRGTPLHLASNVPATGRAPPQSRPSFPSARNPGPRGHRGTHGTQQRHGATAKAPCWAGSDWHPLKAVLSSANHAAAPSGTGVFLPHLAGETNSSSSKAPPQRSASDKLAQVAAQAGVSGHHHSEGKPHAAGEVDNRPNSFDSTAGPSTNTPGHPDTSPACSLDGVSTCSDPWSRSSTVDMDSTGMGPGAAHSVLAMCAGICHGPSPLSAEPLACHPEANREGFDDADEFGPLAKELADLMSRQVMLE